MAGGTWDAQNKIRAGAYINFVPVTGRNSAYGENGVVALSMPLSWGAEVTELLSTDLADGKAFSKLGITSSMEESLPLRLVLSNASKAIVHRSDTGGQQATATNAELTVTALYGGLFGNLITVAIKTGKAQGYFTVETIVKGKTLDVQEVEQIEDLKVNDFVMFEGEGAPTLSAGISLINGTNGSLGLEFETDFLNMIKKYSWNILAYPYTGVGKKELAVKFVEDLRGKRGKYCQAVMLENGAANSEAIISVSQGYETDTEVVTPENFVYYVAGLQAGTGMAQSNTYAVIPNAKKIINPYTDEEIEAKLTSGEFLLSERSDGAVVVEKDINTLNIYTPEKPYAYSKNRVIRVLDGIGTWAVSTFSINYIGKVNNDADGRSIFKGEVIKYLNDLSNLGAIKEFDAATDVGVYAGEEIDGVRCDVAVQPADSMEKLYMTVQVL